MTSGIYTRELILCEICSKKCWGKSGYSYHHKFHFGYIYPQSAKIKIHNKLMNHPVSDATRKKIGIGLSIAKKGKPSNFKNKKHNEKSIEKMRISAQGNTSHLGFKHSIEARKKISIAGIGRKQSLITREKISVSSKERRKTQKFPVKDTSIELKLQDYLRQLNINFYTHYYMNINHAYQCDIFIPEKNLVIEADGDYWHKYPVGTDIDRIRTKELLEKGYKVIRIWEHEIKEMKLEDFKDKINEGDLHLF